MAKRDPTLPRLPAVVVRPDPSQYGAGKVYRRTPDGPLLYDSPAVTSDGKRPTHRLTEIVPRLKPGQTIEEYEREIAAQGSRDVPLDRSLDSLETDVRGPLQQLVREAQRAGVRLAVGETRRSQERQEALFARGRGSGSAPVTWTLTSNHTPGRAADLIADSPAGYRWIQENAPRFGFRVLGDSDPGHVEMPAPVARPRASASGAMDPEILARIQAGQELRRRGRLSPQQDAALRALEQRYASANTPSTEPPPRGVQRGGSVPVESPPAPAPVSSAYAAALAAGHAGPSVPPDMAGALAEGHGGDTRVSPELQAQYDVEAMGPGAGRHAAALNQGAGSMLFGVGTPLTATMAKLVSSLPGGGGETLSWSEALQYARARRQALKEADPWGTRIGQAAGLGAGIGASRAVSAAAPAVERVLAPQAGQRLANIARYAGTGAAASGVTAANEEGLSAAPGAALTGAVFAPLAVGAARGAGKVVGAVANRASPERGAFRILAKRLGEPVEALEQRFNDFRTAMGRPPRLVEIMRQETAEELAQVGRVRPDAGAIFREADEAAALARPQELSNLVRASGRTTSAPELQSRMDPVVREARSVFGRRVRSTSTAEIGMPGRPAGRRGRQMDRVMQTIGNHRVPLTQDMVEVVQHPDVSGALPGPLRRQIANAVDAGEDVGGISLTVRQWDMVRQALAERSGSGAGQIMGRYRDRVRDYVGAAVPEYASALREFGRRSDVARGLDEGAGVLTKRAREFADMIEAANVNERVGIRVSARTALANLFSGSEKKARGAMARLAGDPVLRRNVRNALRPDEVRALERLARQYGMQIEFGQGVQIGRKVMAQADTEAFVEAVAQAGRGTPARAGAAQGARTKLAEAAGESPQRASRVAQSLAEDPGLQQRLEFALGGREAQRLRRVGALSTTAERNLAAATPAGTQASNRAAQHAADIQKYIGAGVVAWGRASGAMIANIGNWAFQHTSLSKKAAERLARIATDPAHAHEAIGRLRAMGVSADEILAMYRDAAVGAGILTGRE